MTWFSMWDFVPDFLHRYKNLSCVIPIHSKYSAKIYDQTKIYEYRRKKIRNNTLCCFIYETSPISKITGFFLVQKVIEDSIQNLWHYTSSMSGVGYDELRNYFTDSRNCIAIEIKDSGKFINPIDIRSINCKAPQSYVYI
jgi:predicted transcriptional regulator